MLSTHHFGLQTVQASYISWQSRTYSLLNHSHVHLLGRAEHKNQEQHGFWSSCTRPQAWTTSIFFIMWGSKALKWHDLCEGFEFGFVFPYIQPNAINAVTWKHPINCPGPPGIFLENTHTHICILTQICIYSQIQIYIKDLAVLLWVHWNSPSVFREWVKGRVLSVFDNNRFYVC